MLAAGAHVKQDDNAEITPQKSKGYSVHVRQTGDKSNLAKAASDPRDKSGLSVLCFRVFCSSLHSEHDLNPLSHVCAAKPRKAA